MEIPSARSIILTVHCKKHSKLLVICPVRTNALNSALYKPNALSKLDPITRHTVKDFDLFCHFCIIAEVCKICSISDEN